MKRRGFLGMLLSAPVVAPIAAKTFASEDEALKQEAIDIGIQLGYENPGMFTAMAPTDADWVFLATLTASRERIYPRVLLASDNDKPIRR